MKYKYFLCALIAVGICFSSFANDCPDKNYQDSIALPNPAYNGHRLEITDIKIVEKENWAFVRFTAINTGREDLSFGKNIVKPFVVLNVDQLSKEYLSAFSKTLLDTDLKIRAGEILFDREIKIKPEKELPTLVEKEILSTEIADINANDSSKTAVTSKGPNESTEDDSNCSDLIIESISVVKKSNNSVTLKYKIKNQGKKPASVIGTTKAEEDNLAMRIHMSSSEKLTRGSILIGGTFLKDGKQIPEGKLYPGKSLTDEIKVDISSMTRFTPIIIIEIDPYLSVQECNETNNLNHVKVEDK